MADLVRYEVKDGVAVVTIDNPPVNALAPGGVGRRSTRRSQRGVADPAAEAIVLIGAGHDVHRRRRHQGLRAAEDARATRWRDRQARTRC